MWLVTHRARVPTPAGMWPRVIWEAAYDELGNLPISLMNMVSTYGIIAPLTRITAKRWRPSLKGRNARILPGAILKRCCGISMMEYKGYIGIVEYDDEAGIFHGEVVNLRDVITFAGESVAELRQRSYARLTTLDCSTHCLCRSGAAV